MASEIEDRAAVVARLLLDLHKVEQENGRYRRMMADAQSDLSVALAALRRDMEQGTHGRLKVTEERLDRWTTEFRCI